MVRDYLRVLDAEDAETAPIDIEWRLGEELDARIRAARAATAEAARLQADAAATTREAIAVLKSEGLSGRDIALILGVSEQRVSQLARK